MILRKESVLIQEGVKDIEGSLKFLIAFSAEIIYKKGY